MIKVIVADSEELVRAGVCSILRGSGGIEVAGETGNGYRAVELALRHQADVLVTDVHLDGIDGVRAASLIRRQARTRVVFLTGYTGEEVIYHCFSAGASGFLTKGVSPREIVEAIVRSAAGETVLSPSVTRCVIDKFLRYDRNRMRLARAKIEMLTSRERDVLTHVARGLGNAEIARALYVSEGAVKAHVSHLLTKLGCANRVQAAIIAHDSDLFALRADGHPTAAERSKIVRTTRRGNHLEQVIDGRVPAGPDDFANSRAV